MKIEGIGFETELEYLHAGECFMYQGDIYLLTDNSLYSSNLSSNENIVIAISDGSIDTLEDSAKVVRLKLKAVME